MTLGFISIKSHDNVNILIMMLINGGQLNLRNMYACCLASNVLVNVNVFPVCF